MHRTCPPPFVIASGAAARESIGGLGGDWGLQ